MWCTGIKMNPVVANIIASMPEGQQVCCSGALPPPPPGTPLTITSADLCRTCAE